MKFFMLIFNKTILQTIDPAFLILTKLHNHAEALDYIILPKEYLSIHCEIFALNIHC